MLAMANGQCPVPCPPAPQPVECNPETELICSDVDEWGCWLGDFCIEAKTGECWNSCPVTCTESFAQFLCIDPPDPVTGCAGAAYCDADEHGCASWFICPEPPAPSECDWETEISCQTLAENGCFLGDFCMPLYTGECATQCPPNCMAHEMLCASPPDTVTDCDTGSYCVPEEDGCPVECPDAPPHPECDWETETWCLMSDEYGCPLGYVCMPQQTGECTNICPVNCMGNEVVCANPPDDTGCDTGSYCESEAYGCPVECPDPPAYPECDSETETWCPMIDEDDCYLGDVCMPLQTGECWNICPMTCPVGEIACSNGVDENGCDLESYCLPDVQKK
jgi:hypothetical protein